MSEETLVELSKSSAVAQANFMMYMETENTGKEGSGKEKAKKGKGENK